MTYCYKCAIKHKLITHGHYSMCKEEGCTRKAYKGGYCQRHCKEHDIVHASKKQCEADGCTRQAQKGGYCQRHGKEHGVAPRKQCEADDCTRYAQKQGRCGHHLRELGIDEEYGKCLMEGCDKHGNKGGGYCYTHARQFNVLAPSKQKESV